MEKSSILNRKLKMGMVGGGRDSFIGEVHRTAARMDGQIEFAAGALSSTPEKSKLSGQDLWLPDDRNYSTYQEMLEKELARPAGERIDFVAIVTPNHLHFPISRAFLEAGFHVVCDKPLALNLKEALELKKIVEASGKVFALTHNYTGYPMVKQARHMVQTDELGKINKIVVEYPQGWLVQPLEQQGSRQAEWRTDPARSGPGGCLGDIGTHADNLVHYITGLEIAEMCAELTTFVPGRQLDDDVMMMLRYRGGAKGILHASQISTGSENGFNIRIWGTKGALQWFQENPNYLHVYRHREPRQIYSRAQDYEYLCEAVRRNSRIPWGHPEAFIEAFANIYRNVAVTIRAVETGQQPDEFAPDFPTIDDGVRGMAFIETAVKSSMSAEKWVKFIVV